MKLLSVLLVLPLFSVLDLPGPAPGGQEAAESVAAANTAFAVDLYRQLGTQEGSFFFSPLSVSTALAMTREGARGETRTEIDAVFHWSPTTDPADHRALVEALRPGMVRDGRGDAAKRVPAFALHVANALWAQEGLGIAKPFERALDTDFGARLQRLDFTDSARAREVINAWVAKHTKDRIQNIVPEGLPLPDTRLALANAIWFKAAWSNPFEERWTAPAPFTRADGKTAEVPLMHRRGDYRYCEDDRVQVVELPYRGDETSMLVILPKTPDGLAAVEKTMTAERIAAWIARLDSTNVSVKLPKFEITCDTDLTDVLPAMGMPSAFDASTADFSGMTEEERLMIGAVLHKAFIKVDEAGTEAAAATVVMMLKGAVGRDPIDFTADHPFAMLIRHRETGAVLFAGRYAGPEA